MKFETEANLSADLVYELFQQAEWTKHRQTADIVKMLQASTVCISAMENGVLIGFARALTDTVYRAFIEDVIVHNNYQGKGIGTQLVSILLKELKSCEEIILSCTEQNVAFYEQFNFEKLTIVTMKKAMQ